MLGRSHLIMLSLCKNAELPEYLVEIPHVKSYPLLYRTEIMVLKLLAFGRRSTEKGPSAEHQVLTLHVVFMVNDKILLLGTY